MGAIRAIKLNKLFRVYATFSVAFLLAFISSSLLTPAGTSSAVDCTNNLTPSGDICGSDTTDVNVSVTGAWTVSISSSGTLNVDVAPSGSGTTSTATDNVNIYTNTPNGYQLYLNSTSGSTDIYNNSDTEHERNHFIATTGTKDSPIALSSNSWGYSLSSNPTTFSKVETSSSAVDSLIRTTTTKTSGSGDNLDVTYGFNADTKLTPGTYTTSVTYTAVAEVPSYTISSISPNEIRIDQQVDRTVTILTSTPSTELGLGDITASITNGANTVNLTNCTEIISGEYRGATCTYNGNLAYGTYNVQLTSSWHSATYTLTNGFIILPTMQNFTATDCVNLRESTTTEDNRLSLIDTRDGKTYNIAKLADGNCWMVQDLQYGITTSSNWYTGDAGASTNIKLHIGTGQGYAGNYYYNWLAATQSCPVHWQLPVYENDTTNKSYAKLINGYGITTTAQLTSNTILGFTSFNGIWDANIAPNGREGYYGTDSNYWYQTTTSSTNAYLFCFGSSYNPISVADYTRSNGRSVRCVFGS